MLLSFRNYWAVVRDLWDATSWRRLPVRDDAETSVHCRNVGRFSGGISCFPMTCDRKVPAVATQLLTPKERVVNGGNYTPVDRDGDEITNTFSPQ